MWIKLSCFYDVAVAWCDGVGCGVACCLAEKVQKFGFHDVASVAVRFLFSS